MGMRKKNARTGVEWDIMYRDNTGSDGRKMVGATMVMNAGWKTRTLLIDARDMELTDEEWEKLPTYTDFINEKGYEED